MVERVLRRDWVTRFAGDMVKPLSSENLGVPPTVNKSTSIGLFSLPAASFHARSTSSRTRASPLIKRAVPEVTYFWMAVLVSNVDGVRRRKVTVAPSSRSLSEEKYPMLRDPPMERTFRFSAVDMSFLEAGSRICSGRASLPIYVSRNHTAMLRMDYSRRRDAT